MFGHLKPAEFVDALEGLPLSRGNSRHLARCDRCRDTIAALAEMNDELDSAIGDRNARALGDPIGSVEWSALRTSVRDGLLARSVKRTSTVQRWTGTPIRPAAAWGLSFALLISLVSLGGIWHYRTDHGIAPVVMRPPATPSPGTVQRGELAGEIDTEVAVDDALDTLTNRADSDADLAPDGSDLGQLEAELLAWSGTDLFSVLHGLERGEEELLRELIAEAEADLTFGDGVLQ